MAEPTTEVMEIKTNWVTYEFLLQQVSFCWIGNGTPDERDDIARYLESQAYWAWDRCGQPMKFNGCFA